MRTRLAARLARREVWRRPGRTALVALLVALPVAAMVIAITLQRTTQQSPLEDFQADNGAFDAVLYVPDPAQVAALPEGTTTLASQQGHAALKVAPGDHVFVDISDVPLTDPRLREPVSVVEGRAPLREGEVTLSPDLADQLGLAVGERLDLGPAPVRGDVVGIAEQRRCLGCDRIVVAPGTALGATLDEGDRLLVDLPPGLSRSELLRLRDEIGLDVAALRTQATGAGFEGRDAQMAWTFVAGGVVLTVMGIVIVAAFAVGARRRLAALGLLSASGTAPRTLGAVLVLEGTFTGLVGAGAGVVLGWALLLAGQSLVEVALDRRIDHYAIAPLPLAAAAAVGVVTATVAAALPARTAARIPTLQAMAGRRPVSRVPRRLTVGGILAVAAGLGLLAIAVVGSQGDRFSDLWAAMAVAGGVLELLGACAAAPVVVARLEPLAGRLRGTGRIAARSLARQRTRSGAVISAVCAAGALAVCAGAVVRGVEARDVRDGQLPDGVVLAWGPDDHLEPAAVDPSVWVPAPPTPEAVREVEGVLSDARAVPVRVARGPWTFDPSGSTAGGPNVESIAVVADEAVLDAFQVGDAARTQLTDKGVVVLQARSSDIAVHLPDGRSWATRSVRSHFGPEGLSTVLVSPLTARDAGVDVSAGAVAVRANGPLTADQRDALVDLSYGEHPGFSYLDWYTAPSGPSPLQLQLLLSGAALVFSVLVVGASLALAAAEGRDERDGLALAGAPPRALARTAGAKAALLAVLGGLLALPIGFLPVVVFSWVDGTGLPLRLPWPAIGALVAVVPAVAAVVAWGTSGAAQRLRPARISTMAFD